MNHDKNLKNLAINTRKRILEMVYHSASSHIGSAFSVVDILAVLYEKILNISPEKINDPLRDRLILSKGHAAAALYAVLAEKDFFPKPLLETYNGNNSIFSGHAFHKVPGVEISSGSLGHGLSISCGFALSAVIKRLDYRCYVILGDGECDEGSVWEAALFAGFKKLNQLTAIIDYNKIQSLGRVEEVLDLHPLAEKWEAFGWDVSSVDGHNYTHLESALSQKHPTKPRLIIAHTVKGKGVKFMENQLLWHYKPPSDEQFIAANQEIELGHEK